VTRAATQTRLEQALTRLLAGQPTTSDGTAFARREAQQPELVALREELATLKREKKQTAQDNARAVRELENAIRIYANQIQAFTLRNAEPEDQLHQRAGHDVSVIRVGPAHGVTRP
jgi:hypothetical protein